MNSNENNQNQTQDTVVSQVPVMEPTPVVENPAMPAMPVVEPAPILENPIVAETPVMEPAPVVEMRTVATTPVMEPTPIVENPTVSAMPVVEPAPILENPAAPAMPVVETTPVVENPAAPELPVVEPTPVVENPTVPEMPVVEPTPVVENPAAPAMPVVEPTPVVENPAAPAMSVVEPTPAVETPTVPTTSTVEPVQTTTQTPAGTPNATPTQTTSAPVAKKTSPIAVVVLVVALIVLVVFGINKLGLFSKDEEKSSGGESTNEKTGTKLEDVSINGHMCMGDECTYSINGYDENSSYVYKAGNKELFNGLSDYKEYIKVNIYYQESKGEKTITGYEIFTKDGNKDISDVKDISQLREKVGLYALGTQTDELTLKSIGIPGVGMSDTESYTYIDYEFENNAGQMFEMRYKFNNGQSSNDLNLEIDKKYNVTFEVVEGTFHVEYNIKSIN